MRLVEIRRAEAVGIGSGPKARQHFFLGRDGEVLFALLRVRPREQSVRRYSESLVRELANELIEHGLRFGVTRLRGESVCIDQQCVRAPHRIARRHLLEHHVRDAGELPQVTDSVVRVLEQAQRRLH